MYINMFWTINYCNKLTILSLRDKNIIIITYYTTLLFEFHFLQIRQIQWSLDLNYHVSPPYSKMNLLKLTWELFIRTNAPAHIQANEAEKQWKKRHKDSVNYLPPTLCSKINHYPLEMTILPPKDSAIVPKRIKIASQ